ncbi:MAG: DUF3846 domain-containing protein [Oscillibacter sp.]|nr:DUF3846 domain-containing protein [Oscillibacter sp.]
MQILIIKPGQKPKAQEIDGTLESMQGIVGGLIQAVYPYEQPVALVANDEGKALGLPLNRGLRDEGGVLYDIICGTFFIVGAPVDSGSFRSLTDAQIQYFMELFATPEMFLVMNGRLLVLPCE